MAIDIEIKIDSHLCKCKEKGYSWGFKILTPQALEFYIECKTCKTSLRIPYKELYANIFIPSSSSTSTKETDETVKEETRLDKASS